MRIIYNKIGGQSTILFDDETPINTEKYTLDIPPSELYQPLKYINGVWTGATKEEWESNLPKTTYEPSEMEQVTASLQMQLMKSNVAQMQAQKQVAALLLENEKKNNEIQNMQTQQANMMLEITKLKGGN